MRGLSAAEAWMAPPGVTSIGFHVAHLSGSTDRLLTYARGEALDDAQKQVLGRERMLAVERPPIETLLDTWLATVDRALAQLAATADASLTDAARWAAHSCPPPCSASSSTPPSTPRATPDRW